MSNASKEKNHILLIGWRNLYSATGEWQLIANRARAIYENTGLRTEAGVMVNLAKHGARAQVENPEGFSVEIFDASPGKRVSEYFRLWRWAKGKRSSSKAVILSGLPLYPLIGMLRNWGIPVFSDIHGAYEEIEEYRLLPYHLNGLLLKMMNFFESSISRFIAGRLVVSEHLARHTRKLFKEMPTFVIPCGVIGPDDQLMSRRNLWRDSYGWQDKIVWNYCGGLSVWQHVDEIIDEFAKLPGDDDHVLWLMTPAPDVVKRKCLDKGIPARRIVCEHLTPAEVDARLPAADIGFLIRDDNITNRVAFPNKFAQYINCGLLVLMTSIKSDPVELAEKFGIAFFIDNPWVKFGEDPCLSRVVAAVKARNKNIPEFHGRCYDLVCAKLTYKSNVAEFADAIVA